MRNDNDISVDNPCFACSERTAVCHIDCERHHEWKAENENKKKWLKSRAKDDYDRNKSLKWR